MSNLRRGRNSDLENEAAGHVGPVTDCHIETAWHRGFEHGHRLWRFFRALRVVLWLVPKVLSWAAMGRTFGAQEEEEEEEEETCGRGFGEVGDLRRT